MFPALQLYNKLYILILCDQDVNLMCSYITIILRRKLCRFFEDLQKKKSWQLYAALNVCNNILLVYYACVSINK